MPKTNKSTCGANAVAGARDRILDTAIRLFCEEGIHATGIDRIIEESGVARMTLYNRFGSKRGLIHAALEREGETWRAWYEKELKRSGQSARERLLGVFDVLEKWFVREDFFGCAFLNAVAEHNKADPHIRELTISHKKQVLTPIAALAEQEGYADPNGVAHQLGILMDGAIITALVTENPKVARDVRTMAEALLDALPRDATASAA
ncbi:TetR/AcrR family transcriptional regulator [Magnetospira sp. QH-2]|uniref:TetR/AcrR family transcriptional regulator n=1 Tax=Magnetospira sp. (strain QH-2) TaxID=1288970 RepID=UPI0003E8146A|nr:TetR/AcrR family transcriptional regulator [Magnetospira sp. QH-2]CCQ74956.1 putative Transcriptional regulatory protein, TetR family [Magnetospira sp. QH-2]